MNRLLITLVVLSLIVTNCSSRPPREEQTRFPASVEEAEVEVTETLQLADNSFATIALDRNLHRLNNLLLGLKLAQGLVSSFDARLRSINRAQDLERLHTSNLYCKLQTTRTLHEAVTEKLEIALSTAAAMDPAGELWFYQKLSDYAQVDVVAKAAVTHFLRRVVNSERQICGTNNCVRSKISGELLDYLDEARFARFLNQNAEALAPQNFRNSSDLEPGNCIEISARSPNQEQPYDWSRRNWIKGNTNPGEFVITYDDGPHPQLTEQLMTVWNQSGLAKPAFFWLSKNANQNRVIVARAKSQGFPIGNHSERHLDLGNIVNATSFAALNSTNKRALKTEIENTPVAQFSAWKDRTLRREIVQAPITLRDIVRETDPTFQIRYFRLPFGSGLRNARIGSLLAQGSLDHFFWAVDSLDWQDSSSTSIHARVLNQMKTSGRGLILFHDIQKPTVEASRLLIQTFRNSKAYKAVSIRQMTQ